MERDGWILGILKTEHANGLGARVEERKIKDKLYIWKIRNIVSGGAREADLEGKNQEFSFSHVMPETPVKYSNGDIKQTVVHEFQGAIRARHQDLKVISIYIVFKVFKSPKKSL